MIFLPSGTEWKRWGEVPDGVCCVSELHSPSVTSSLLPGREPADYTSHICFPPGFQGKALAGVSKARGRKKASPVDLVVLSLRQPQQRQRQPWASAGFWVSANSANAVLTTHCELLVTSFSLRSFESGGGSHFLQLLIFGKSYLPTFSPLALLTFTTNFLFEN